MMDVTDRHFRFVMRKLTKNTLLYTPMIVSQALYYGNHPKLLKYHPDEQALALQTGGSNPKHLAYCAKIAEEFGFQEINLNVGCPSDRVKRGGIGACLMAQPELVAECVASMKAVSKIPVTVKHRIGIDELDQYEHLHHFVNTVSKANCDQFIVHARKAWLKGLSPKENRTVPPIQYEHVYQLKKDFPQETIIINGDIKSLEAAKKHLQYVDGVMLGRVARDNPYIFAEADSKIFDKKNLGLNRKEIIQEIIPYLEKEVAAGEKAHNIARHLLTLFVGLPGAKLWRQNLSNGKEFNAQTAIKTLEQMDSLKLATPGSRAT